MKKFTKDDDDRRQVMAIAHMGELIMCRSGVTCLPADCCFSELGQLNSGHFIPLNGLRVMLLAHLTRRVIGAIAIIWRPSSSYVVNPFKNLLL